MATKNSGKVRKKKLPQITFDKKGTEEGGMFKVTYVHDDCRVIYRHTIPPDAHFTFQNLVKCEFNSIKIELDTK